MHTLEHNILSCVSNALLMVHRRYSIRLLILSLSQLLRYLGWDFVSLVVSDAHHESTIGAAAFHAVAGAARVCVGKQFLMIDGQGDRQNKKANFSPRLKL